MEGGKTQEGKARLKCAGFEVAEVRAETGWEARCCQVQHARRVRADESNLGVIHTEPGMGASREPTVGGRDWCEWETRTWRERVWTAFKKLVGKGKGQWPQQVQGREYASLRGRASLSGEAEEDVG